MSAELCDFADFVLTGTGRVDAVRQVTVPEGTFSTFPVALDVQDGDFFTRSRTLAFNADACWFVHAKPGPITAKGTLAAAPRDTSGSGVALVLAGVAAAGVLVARKRS